MKIFPQNNSYLYENYIKKRQLDNRKAGYPNSYEKFFPKQSHSKSFQLPPLQNYIIQNNEQTKFLVEHENNMKSLGNSKLEHNTERYISYIRNSISLCSISHPFKYSHCIFLRKSSTPLQYISLATPSCISLIISVRFGLFSFVICMLL